MCVVAARVDRWSFCPKIHQIPALTRRATESDLLLLLCDLRVLCVRHISPSLCFHARLAKLLGAPNVSLSPP